MGERFQAGCLQTTAGSVSHSFGVWEIQDESLHPVMTIVLGYWMLMDTPKRDGGEKRKSYTHPLPQALFGHNVNPLTDVIRVHVTQSCHNILSFRVAHWGLDFQYNLWDTFNTQQQVNMVIPTSPREASWVSLGEEIREWPSWFCCFFLFVCFFQMPSLRQHVLSSVE